MRNEQIKRIGRFYSIAGTLVVLFIAINMIVENLVYVQSRRIYENNMAAVQTMTDIKSTLADINENVMLMVAGMAGENDLSQIDEQFAYIDSLKEEYLAMNTQSAPELRRFSHAVYAIESYQRKIEDVGQDLMTARFEKAHSIFTQELDPLHSAASEMLDATSEIGINNAAANVHRSSLMHGFAQMTLILLTVAGVVGLFFAGRSQIRDAQEMQLKEEELEEASDRLVASRQKLFDSAHTNILTGLRNRYGLEKYLGDLIGKKQFYIGVFDIDNFRMVNDQYGYEYGDEYLIAVSDRLKSQFAEHGELFNIYGNEFCMIFNDKLSDMQVKSIAEQLRQNMGSNTQVAGMMLSTTASGSLAHILPSENADVNNVLRQLDTALHAAKADGGNRMYYI